VAGSPGRLFPEGDRRNLSTAPARSWCWFWIRHSRMSSHSGNGPVCDCINCITKVCPTGERRVQIGVATLVMNDSIQAGVRRLI